MPVHYDIPDAAEVLKARKDWEAIRPRTPDALHLFVERVLGWRVPREAAAPGNDAPFDYLVHVLFEGEDAGAEPQALVGAEDGDGERAGVVRAASDVVVWACRGGGKTVLGAIATVLDMLFKPGVQVRVLSGSVEQGSRMWEHLTALVQREWVREMLAFDPSDRQIMFKNGSRAELLAQSEASVRGVRVQKLRCDEVDLFDRDVWEAAQLTTRSAKLGGRKVRGAVEAMSTYHRPAGVMSELTVRKGVRVFRWSALDVAGRCPPELPCDKCPIVTDCRGMLKRGSGFVPVEDLLVERQRLGKERWDSEMMCRRPSTAELVYPDFDPTPGGPHVRPVSAGGGESVLVGGARPGKRAKRGHGYPNADPPRHGTDPWGPGKPLDGWFIAAIDFGIRSPFVLLWARFWPGRPGHRHVGAPFADPRLGLVEIVDEHYQEGWFLDQHVRVLETRGWPKPVWVGVDPAGGARNPQTQISDIQFLRKRGYDVRAKRVDIRVAISMIRRRLENGSLIIDPRCRNLIRSMSEYSYDRRNPSKETPMKNGPDHACDALRYLIVNLETGPVAVDARSYL